MYYSSNVNERNENGRTRVDCMGYSFLHTRRLKDSLTSYGMPVIDDPENPVILGIEGEQITMGAKTYLKNERKGLSGDSYELNEVIRQFPFTEAEAFRDSAKASLFNVQKIYEQIEYNQDLYTPPL